MAQRCEVELAESAEDDLRGILAWYSSRQAPEVGARMASRSSSRSSNSWGFPTAEGSSRSSRRYGFANGREGAADRAADLRRRERVSAGKALRGRSCADRPSRRFDRIRKREAGRVPRARPAWPPTQVRPVRCRLVARLMRATGSAAGHEAHPEAEAARSQRARTRDEVPAPGSAQTHDRQKAGRGRRWQTS